MRKFFPLLISFTCLLPSSYADEINNANTLELEPTTAEEPAPEAPPTPKKPFEAFTGKITKNKVRLRLQPNFDGTPLRELNRDQLLLIIDEADDFYAVKPLNDIKGYIYRTYVLDDTIEGTRVNVRTKPDLDAPVIAQMNSGDKVHGHIYNANNKWMEISLPPSARLYVSKEYVEKAGDAGHLARTEKRQEEVVRLLITTKTSSDAELAKSFDAANIDNLVANYQKIISDYKDFPDAVGKAKEYLASLQDAYTKKKIAFLEQQAQNSSKNLEQENKKLNTELESQKTKLAQLEKKIKNDVAITTPAPDAPPPAQLPFNMSAWVPVEDQLIIAWGKETGKEDPHQFYEQQKENAITMKGIIDSYNRPVKNKPGDFMLLNASSKLPVAFLYSTQVNLQQYMGHEVTIRVAPRENYHYAFPAYFVLSIE